MPSGQEGQSVLQGTGSWGSSRLWLARGPKTAQGTQLEAGAQKIHKMMRCKHHWSSLLRHPQPSAQEGSRVRYNHMRGYKKCKVNLSCKFKLACWSVKPWLVKPPFWKFSPLLKTLRPLASSLLLHIVTTSLGKWVATCFQVRGPRDCLTLLAAALQSLLSCFQAVNYLPALTPRNRHDPGQERLKFIMVQWLLRNLCESI